MVKRTKSPDLSEDARYFTVYQPYPFSANWIMEDDQKKCARWIAECIGLNLLWAIHYKPTARGMILLEVSKSFTDHGRLLGEHRWADILTKPDNVEKKSVTQVFYSFYTRLRDCQKDGWKTINVQMSWFKDWKPGQGNIKQPYVATHWCDTPPEDRTNKPLCRPIPNESAAPTVPIAPPSRPPPPVVGSSKWVETQKEGLPNTSETNIPGEKKPPLLEIPAVNAIAQDNLGTRSPSPSVSSPGPGNNAPTSGSNKAQAPRPKPVSLNTFISGEKKTGNSTWAKTPSSAKFSVTDPAPAAPVNAWTRRPNLPPREKEAKVTIRASNEPKMDYSGWGPPSTEREQVSTQTTFKSASGPPDERPPYKGKKGKGKGKQRDDDKRPNEQYRKDRKPGEESFHPRGGKSDRKPPKRDTFPDPPPVMDWSATPLPENDWNRPIDNMDVDAVDMKKEPPLPSSFSSPYNDKKRKPDGGFNKDGEPQYDKYGEPSNRGSDSSPTKDSFSSDRGRDRGGGRGGGEGRGRGRGRGRGHGEGGTDWDSRDSHRDQGPRDWDNRSSSRGGRGDRDNSKRSSYHNEPGSKKWGDRSFSDAGNFKADDKDETPMSWGPVPGAEWGFSPLGKDGEKDKDELDWALDTDQAMEVDNNKDGGENNWPTDTHEEPPQSADEGDEEGQWDDDRNKRDATEGGSKADSSGWGNAVPKTRDTKGKVKPAAKQPGEDYDSWHNNTDNGQWAAVAAELPKKQPGEDYDSWPANPDPWAAKKPAKKRNDTNNWNGGSKNWASVAGGGGKGSKAKPTASSDWGADLNSWGGPVDTSHWADAAAELNPDPNDPWSKPADYDGWIPEGVIPEPVPLWDTILEQTVKPKRPEPEEELICPTHNIACKKGICKDMAALVRKRHFDNWMLDRGNGGGVGPKGGIRDPQGPRGTLGAKELPNGEVITYKKTRRGKKKSKPVPPSPPSPPSGRDVPDDENAGWGDTDNNAADPWWATEGKTAADDPWEQSEKSSTDHWADSVDNQPADPWVTETAATDAETAVGHVNDFEIDSSSDEAQGH